MQPTSSRPSQLLSSLSAWYLAGLFAWYLLRLLLGDGFGYLGLINAVAVYLFAPLPVALLIAVWQRRWRLLLAGLLAAGLFAATFGPLLLPRPTIEAQGPVLRVMTFNVLDRAGDPQDVIASILAEDADIVFLQEVSPSGWAVFNQALSAQWPYSYADPRYSSDGLAIFSRIPMQRVDIELGGRWQGKPQVLRLDWQGQTVTLVNFHALSTGGIWPPFVRYTTRERNQAAQQLADFVAGESGPVIAAGDANATFLNRPYAFLDAVMDDAWMQAGYGLGHTFPGPIGSNDGLTATIGTFFVPHWVAGLDHIFYNDSFVARSVWLAEFHGGSDHRGIVAELVLLQN